MNFKKKGSMINYSFEERIINIPISSLLEGINTFPNFFIKQNNGKIIYIIDRTCDHNGGKLINKRDKAICPLHGWELNLETLKYNDSFECKQQIPFKINVNNELEFLEKKYILIESFNIKNEK